RDQRNRDPVPLRFDALRKQGRATRRQSLRNHLRGHRAPRRPRRARAVEGRPGDLVLSDRMTFARAVMERCDLLATFTEEPGTITRPFATDSMRRVNELVRGWMDKAGMAVTRDNIGNLRGRYEGTGRDVLLLGSHLDSVRHAGRYDGPL